VARRRRRRWPWILLTVVVVLAGLFVAADRVALALAEDKAATTLQNSENLSSKPTVHVAGFPFLTQLLAGHFDEVTISDDDVQVGGDRTLRIGRVTVHLRDVTVPNDYSSVRAATATADARAGYDDLSRTLGVPIRYAGNGRVSTQASATVLGQTFHGTVTAGVHASTDQGITFTDPKVTAAGVTLPDAASRALADVFSAAISLSGLPFHVQVTGAEADSSGVDVHLTGRDLVYRR
jgi:LmeA-like phospholipid-binding